MNSFFVKRIKTFLLVAVASLTFATSSMALDREEYKRRAEAGDVKAQYSLGYELLFRGRDKDDKENGLRWLYIAAQGGHREAQYALGYHFSTNNAKGEAIKWFKMAAANGHEEALRTLQRFAKAGSYEAAVALSELED